MQFAIQKNFKDTGLTMEHYALVSETEHDPTHSCCYVSNPADAAIVQMNNEEAIPFGSIQFVKDWIEKIHKKPFRKPIEIPEVLREPQYLCRKYFIIKSEKLKELKDSLSKGVWFVKYVDEAKTFSEFREHSELSEPLPLPGHYVISEKKMILSESMSLS